MASETVSTTTPRGFLGAGPAPLVWLALGVALYALLLGAGGFGLLAPVPNGLTFNSMLLHLLHGRFDVDPAAIGAEGYLRDGRVYAYFGVFPALFRAAFVWLPNFASTDLTRVACLVAVSVMASFKIFSVHEVCRHAGVELRATLPVLFVAVLIGGGAQVQFLRPSIYQEVELWSGAMAAAFVYLVLRGLMREPGFTAGLVNALAAVAGLSLMTRVSMALGLYVATGLVWLGVAWSQRRPPRHLLSLAVPLAILGAFAAAAAMVNLMRWGNPLVFADFSRALILPLYPDRLARLQHYGAFNLHRIGYGLGYYFLPLWVLHDGAGHLIWSGFENGFTGCCVELPPSSFLVSDTLVLGLAGRGLAAVVCRHSPRPGMALAAAGGLFVPPLLMLTAFAMSFRYRLEFYPCFELLAFLGFGRVLAAPGRGAAVWIGIGALAGIAAALALWFLYMLSPFGPAGPQLDTQSIGGFYSSLFR